MSRDGQKRIIVGGEEFDRVRVELERATTSDNEDISVIANLLLLQKELNDCAIKSNSISGVVGENVGEALRLFGVNLELRKWVEANFPEFNEMLQRARHFYLASDASGDMEITEQDLGYYVGVVERCQAIEGLLRMHRGAYEFCYSELLALAKGAQKSTAFFALYLKLKYPLPHQKTAAIMRAEEFFTEPIADPRFLHPPRYLVDSGTLPVPCRAYILSDEEPQEVKVREKPKVRERMPAKVKKHSSRVRTGRQAFKSGGGSRVLASTVKLARERVVVAKSVAPPTEKSFVETLPRIARLSEGDYDSVRVLAWFDDPKSAIARGKYRGSDQHLINIHAFSPIFDSLVGTRFSFVGNWHSTSRNEDHRYFGIPAVVFYEGGKEERVVFQYTLDTKGICYHRCMGQTSNSEMIEMMLTKTVWWRLDWPELEDAATLTKGKVSLAFSEDRLVYNSVVGRVEIHTTLAGTKERIVVHCYPLGSDETAAAMDLTDVSS